MLTPRPSSRCIGAPTIRSIQSSTLDATGGLVKHYTHKGYSATSTWGRAQAWGILFSVMSYLSAPDEALWLEAAERGADWCPVKTACHSVISTIWPSPTPSATPRHGGASRACLSCQGGDG